MAQSIDKAVEQRTEYTKTDGSIKSNDSIDKSNDLTDDLQAQQLADQWVNNTPAEKKLVRKLDWRILPCCWVLYLLGFLDRANIG